VDVTRVAQQIEREATVQFLHQGDHRFVRREDIFPRGDELRLGPAITQDVERPAQKCRAIHLPVLVGELDLVDPRHHIHRIGHIPLLREFFQCDGKVELKQNVTDIEKECADHDAGAVVSFLRTRVSSCEQSA